MDTLVDKYWYQCSLGILITITLLSLIPLPQLPEVPGTDKSHHLIAYAALMFPVALRKPKRWVLLGCFFIVWSGVIELIQPMVNRYGEWLDLLANSVGVLIGLLIGFIVRFLMIPKLEN